MRITFTKKDIEIARGWKELVAIANSDIDGTDGPRLPSQRTVDLYDDIIRSVEIDRDLNSN